MFFAEYSLLAMFDTYPASKCTIQDMYTRVCAGVVVIVSSVAILICDVEQAISATLMDSSEALIPKKKAGIVNFR